MKKIILFAVSVIAFCSACTRIDTYEVPSCVVEGVVIDRETMKPIELCSGKKGRVCIRCEEVNPQFTSPSYYDIPLGLKGTFQDHCLFETTYKMYPHQMPVISDTCLVVHTKKNEPQKIKVLALPYFRAELEAQLDTLLLTVTKPDGVPYTGFVSETFLMYATHPDVSEVTSFQEDYSMVWWGFPGGNSIKIVDGKTYKIPMSVFKNLKKGRYYFRFKGKLKGAPVYEANYSNVVEGYFSGEREVLPEEQ